MSFQQHVSNPHALFQRVAWHQRGGRGPQGLEPSRCPHFCGSCSCTSSHLAYTHHPGPSASHLPAAPCPANGGRPRSWPTRLPCAGLSLSLLAVSPTKEGTLWYRRGEEARSCNWPAEDAPLPRGDFPVTTIFINACRNKKWQQVKYNYLLPQLLGGSTSQLVCFLYGRRAEIENHW